MSTSEPILTDDRGRPVPPRSDGATGPDFVVPNSFAPWPLRAWRSVWRDWFEPEPVPPPPYAPQGDGAGPAVDL